MLAHVLVGEPDSASPGHALDRSVVDESVFLEGVMIDGSSIAGWKAIIRKQRSSRTTNEWKTIQRRRLSKKPHRQLVFPRCAASPCFRCVSPTTAIDFPRD
jgi:hypothetical protein